MDITIEVTGVKEAVEGLQVIADRARDLRPAFKRARVLIIESVNRNFMAGGRPGWLPLRPATIKRRRGKGSARPLRDTGRLMASIGSIDKISKDELRVGTNVAYAGAQNFGIAGHIPARPFMMLQPVDVERIVSITAEYLTGEDK